MTIISVQSSASWVNTFGFGSERRSLKEDAKTDRVLETEVTDTGVARLLKLRLVVARVGEMDCSEWWNTKGQLGALGSSVLQRGFPRTHHFAQARAVFAVAADRCEQIYDAPNSVTLWKLPAEIEDEFELRWEQWLDHAEEWALFFEEIEDGGEDLAFELQRLELVTDDQVERAKKLRRSAEQRAVQVPGEFQARDDDVTMLALAFSKGKIGSLAVPYQSWSGDA